MEHGGVRGSVASVIAAVCALHANVACNGETANGASANGGTGGGGACRDYVTADGFTCCCGKSYCSRTPGCLHGDTMTFPPVVRDAGNGGGGGAGAGGAGMGGRSAAPYPAPHADPALVRSNGGSVLEKPRIVPIFFPGDPLKPQIESFLSTLAGSSYWTTTTSEYGVGALSVGPSVTLSGAAPVATSDSGITSFIAGLLEGPRTGWPALTRDDVYAIFFPESTSITYLDQTSCVGFDGYHDEGFRAPSSRGAPADAGDAGDAGEAEGGSTDGAPFVYAVIARCPDNQSSSQFDGVTNALSHELIEASTDPLIHSNPAYGFLDADNAAWEFGLLQGLSELADLCLYDENSSDLLGDFAVQRSWSNRAAATKGDPCVPASSTAYFAAAPDLTDSVTVYGQSTVGVDVPVGTSKTVEVRLFSTARTPDWHVAAVEGPVFNPGTSLEFRWNKQTGNNGDVLELTITRVANGPLDGASVFVVYSSATVADAFALRGNAWPGLVAN